LLLSKYRNDGSPLVNNVFSDNCPSGVTTIWNPGVSGTIASIFPGFDANGRFIEYTITDFSEFWLHGSQVISPLSVNLIDFTANCETTENSITWSTSSETNCSHFILETSRDGANWTQVGIKQGSGTTQQIHNYTMTDESNSAELVYYRLTQVDYDGTKEVIGLVPLNCGNNGSSGLSVYPNPSSGEFTVEISSATNQQMKVLQIQDMTGKIVYSQTITIGKGITKISVNQLRLARGNYMINVLDETQQFKPVSLVIMH
jgi:hypothetical protein